MAAGALAAVLPLLTGCFLLEGPQPRTPDRPAPPPAEEAAEFVPGGSAEQNLPYFSRVLHDYAESEQPILGQPVVDAVSAAGFDRAAMQVSFDESKLGYQADSIFVSVRIESDCLLGQLVGEGRELAVAVEPAVGPESDICIIGETRPIDW